MFTQLLFTLTYKLIHEYEKILDFALSGIHDAGISNDVLGVDFYQRI